MPTGIPSFEERIRAASKALEVTAESLVSVLVAAGLPPEMTDAVDALDSGAFSRSDIEDLIRGGGLPLRGTTPLVVYPAREFLQVMNTQMRNPECRFPSGPVYENHLYTSIDELFDQFRRFGDRERKFRNEDGRVGFSLDVGFDKANYCVYREVVNRTISELEQMESDLRSGRTISVRIPGASIDGAAVQSNTIPILKLKMASAALIPEKKVAPGPVWVEHNAGINRQPVEQWDDHSLLWEFIGEREEGKQEALGRELVRRAKGSRFIVIGMNGAVDVAQSLQFLKSARKGRDVPKNILVDGTRWDGYILGVEAYLSRNDIEYVNVLGVCRYLTPFLVGGTFCPYTGYNFKALLENPKGRRFLQFIFFKNRKLDRLDPGLDTHRSHWLVRLREFEAYLGRSDNQFLENFAPVYQDPDWLEFFEFTADYIELKFPLQMP
jgi:hypothetical protein